MSVFVSDDPHVWRMLASCHFGLGSSSQSMGDYDDLVRNIAPLAKQVAALQKNGGSARPVTHS